jgi:hypothetical protein
MTATTDDQSLDNNHGNPMSFMSSRFDAEVLWDLILRVSELVTVGQPDVRAAVTIAAYQLGHAVLNHTVELGVKLETATQHFDAATCGKMERSKMAESFCLQMDFIKRARADLEEIVMSSLIQGVVMQRV